MSTIPRTLHYCYFLPDDAAGRPWELINHVCLASAVAHIRPDRVYFHCEAEPTGPWWELTRPLVEPVRVRAPRTVSGNPVSHPAHRADVFRLQVLSRDGGIYLDTDVLVHRAFDSLLDNDVLLGAEGVDGRFGTCNAVVLARPGAAFLERWLAAYSSFRGTGSSYWNEHSVKIPGRLSRQHPEEITVADYRTFFWPLWTPSHLHWIFADSAPCISEHTLATHLWAGKSLRYTRGLTPGDVRRHPTNFHGWAMPYLAGLPDDYGRDGPPIAWASRLPGRIERGVGALTALAHDMRARVLPATGLLQLAVRH